MTSAPPGFVTGDHSGATADALRLKVMGPLRLWRGDVELDAGPRQRRCLLALLLAREGRPIGMTDLIDLVWGSSPPASAVNIIHKYVGALRRLLEPELRPRASGAYIVRHGNGYRFAADPETLDLVAFRRLVDAAKASAGQDRPEEALDRYTEALRICQGSAGDALADSASAVATFANVDGEFFDAAVAAADIAIRVRQPARILGPLRLAAQMGPLNEPVHASLVTSLAAVGHQAEALQAYRTIRARLADEIGIDPGRELQNAQRRALTQTVPAPGEEPDTGRPIMQLIDDRGAVPLVRPAQLPPDLPLFVGREAELAVLRDLVAGMSDCGRTSPVVVAMDGMGGVGKSTLAAHFAHLVSDEFPDGQLYLDLQGHLSEDEGVPPGEALRSLLYALGVPASNVPDTSNARTGMYRSLTAGKRFLVLLDNVRDALQVRPLLPNSAESLVLVTSRRPLVGLAASDGAHLLQIDLPDLPSARELLERRLVGLANRTVGDAANADVVEEIIELCGRLPLALAILAARIAARSRLSLGTVAAELRDGAQRLEAFSGAQGVIDPRTAFSWSYRQLSPGAARLFRLLSIALSPGVTAEAVVSVAGQDPQRTRAELEELAEAALITEDDLGRFSSHVLVKAYAEELFLATEPAAEREAAVGRLLQHYLHSSFNAQVVLEPHRTPIAPPPPLPGVVPERSTAYHEAIEWFAARRDVLKEAIRLAADVGHGIQPWQLAITMQQYLQWAGYFRDWEDIMRTALCAARRGGDAVGEAHVLRSLAGAKWFLGANEEALNLLSDALRIYTDRGMLLEQGLVHSNLHYVYSTLGRDDLALANSEKAGCLYRIAGSSRTEIFALKSSGKSLTRLGQPEESTRLLRRALELNQEIGRMHEEAEIRLAIAHNHIDTGQRREAVEQLERSADAAGEVGQRPYQFEALRTLAELLVAMGEPARAREAYERARSVLGSFQAGGTATMRADLESVAEKLNVAEKRP